MPLGVNQFPVAPCSVKAVTASSPLVAPATFAAAVSEGPASELWAWTSRGAVGSAPLHSLTSTNSLLAAPLVNWKEVRPPGAFLRYQIEVPPLNSLSSTFTQLAGAVAPEPSTACSCTVATRRSPATVAAGSVTVSGLAPVAPACWTTATVEASVPTCSTVTSSK